MKYVTTVNGKTLEVELKANGPGRYVLVAFGREQNVTCTQQADGTLSIALGNDRFDVQLDGDEVDLGVRRVAVEALTLREAQKRKLQEAAGGASDDWQVKSPMPGKVVHILVTPGTEVKKGAGLVVIEAMKMENELRAPEAGIIGEILVSPGQTVEAGAVLLRASS